MAEETNNAIIVMNIIGIIGGLLGTLALLASRIDFFDNALDSFAYWIGFGLRDIRYWFEYLVSDIQERWEKP